jgi:hypothetical protein
MSADNLSLVLLKVYIWDKNIYKFYWFSGMHTLVYIIHS